MSPRRLAFALASLLALAAAAPAAARPFTAADLVGLDRASDPHVSPDGRTVAFVLRRTDGEKNRGVTSLMLMDLVGPEHAVMHIGGPEDDGASSPRWSQSGALYFLKQGQVWNTYGGGCAGLHFEAPPRPDVPPPRCVPVPPPHQVTHLPLDVDTFRVSPDGRRLIVSMAVFPDAEDPAATKARMDARKADKSTGQLYDHLFVRHWDTWADGTKNHLFAVDLAGDGARATPLTPGFDGDVARQALRRRRGLQRSAPTAAPSSSPPAPPAAPSRSPPTSTSGACPPTAPPRRRTSPPRTRRGTPARWSRPTGRASPTAP